MKFGILPYPVSGKSKSIKKRKERIMSGGSKQRVKYEAGISAKYKSHLIRCRKKGFYVPLTEEQFNYITSLDCYYCGSTLNIGVDRIDSKEGYTIENSRPCCTKCNMMKYVHSEEDFINHIKKIISNLNSKE